MYVNSQGQVIRPLYTVGSTLFLFDEIVDILNRSEHPIFKLVSVTEPVNLGLT